MAELLELIATIIAIWILVSCGICLLIVRTGGDHE